MIKFCFFICTFLSFSVFAVGPEEAWQNEPTICRNYNYSSSIKNRGYCNLSKDGQRILILSPALTQCSNSFPPFTEKYDYPHWVLTEINANNKTLIRSTKLCSLSVGGPWNSTRDLEVYSFGETEDTSQIWIAYREIGYNANPDETFKIVKFSPNGSELQNIFVLQKFKLFNQFSESHTPVFIYLEDSKEFLFYSENGSGQSKFLDMNSEVKFEIPHFTKIPYLSFNGVDISVSGYRAIYRVIDGNSVYSRASFGVYDLKTGKTIYEYPGQMLELSSARFIYGSEQYVYFRGLYKGDWVANVIDIVSGEVKPVSPKYP